MNASLLIDQQVSAEATREFLLAREQIPATLFARGLAGTEDAIIQVLARGGETLPELLIEDGEDAWNESVDANVTSTASAAEKKVGANSAQLAVAVGAAANAILATEALAPLDLSLYDQVKLWIRSTINVAANQLQLLLDDTANCASPVLTLNIPALTQNVWQRVVLPYDRTAAGLNAIISIGIKQVADLGVVTLNLDDVNAEQAWTDVIEGGTALKLDVNNTARVLDQPGRYRVKLLDTAGPVQVGLY